MDSHALTFIQDLAIIMFVAGIITVLCHRFKQPVVLGYIISGIIIGPHTPPFSFIHDAITIKTLAELGVIFLMFYLGLEFNLYKLKSVGTSGLVTALLEISVMMWLGYQVGLLFNWSTMNAIFLGATIAISSTTIIIKALEELNLKGAKFAHLVFGILIIEDIFAIIILTLLSGIAITGGLQVSEVSITTIKLFSFLVISLIIGILLIPKFLTYISKFNNDEMLLISTLGLCFGFCFLTVKLGYSVALGAFIIGAIIAESHQLNKIQNIFIPIRDMFSAIFFVTIGLLFNPSILLQYALPIIVITCVVVVGKIVTCSIGAFITGRDMKTSIRVGMSLAQIGEFSFIIATLGERLKVTSDFLFPIVVTISAITTFLTPYLIKYSDVVTKKINSILPEKMANIFKWYTLWIQNIQPEAQKTEYLQKTQSAFLQIIVNLIIVTTIFFSCSYLLTTTIGKYFITIINLSVLKTMIWGAALFISLPFLLAIYRKVKMLSMLLAELSVKERVDQRFTLTVRRIIAEIIPIISLIGILLFISVLSTRILPPFELLIIMFLLMISLVFLLNSTFNKLYAKLENKLIETIRKPK